MIYTISALLLFLIYILLLLAALSTRLFQKNYTAPPVQTPLPSCAVIIPCKGFSEDLERNLSAFCHLSHPNYTLLFVVEDAHDPAAEVIRTVCATTQKGTLIVAGRTKTSCQKNHNLRAGVAHAKDVDILLFADADIQPSPHWLESMIAPLSTTDVTAVTGFRWLYSRTNTLGSSAHAFQNYCIFIAFSLSSRLWNGGLWGGSTAISRQDYDELGVDDLWSHTGVDDLSLSQHIRRHKRKSVLAYSCLTETDKTIRSYTKSISWYIRQVQYLKFYQRRDWYGAIAMAVIHQASIILSVSTLLIAPHLFHGWAGIVALLLTGGPMIVALPFFTLGKSGSPWFFIATAPISFFSVTWALLYSCTSNTIRWSGYAYQMDSKGTVQKITDVKGASS
ncbi:glycosyltransferase [Chitinivibrio alkaliphilus]|uniref:Glycosyltransferase, family 2 n=1 Tax=Chitinivibrio alkaliphilus ACht1 TaxID=1313304 RepID=U7D9Q2_9BACT|nr:glycosyltransferase family 2 protein [Chitinivibrio alkaliphilus]ERP31145.1 glycosyltransferase, family 2 [Chitinivibrio alkaliphilus ACht1]